MITPGDAPALAEVHITHSGGSARPSSMVGSVTVVAAATTRSRKHLRA